ncbi:hypothetical protein D0865_06310 [Hortaea werneckii]|uniref:Uncharacterized protein n=1 Tax=Hortaea werneckii TaxID=91943 RepID=A0A3M7CHK3_HORWE|nr:hypothetical protein D0865_06310 [Hortaea werneckii]
MSREQYVPPTLTQDSAQQGGASSTGVGGFNITGANTFEDNRPVNYLCGDCDAKVVLRKSEAIRCKECGYRVLYKERTNRPLNLRGFFLARETQNGIRFGNLECADGQYV